MSSPSQPQWPTDPPEGLGIHQLATRPVSRRSDRQSLREQETHTVFSRGRSGSSQGSLAPGPPAASWHTCDCQQHSTAWGSAAKAFSGEFSMLPLTGCSTHPLSYPENTVIYTEARTAGSRNAVSLTNPSMPASQGTGSHRDACLCSLSILGPRTHFKTLLVQSRSSDLSR